MNFIGVFLGALSFLIIGIWHPIVIKGEYYFGKKVCAPIFAVIGIACIIIALNVENVVLNTAISLFGFSALWGILEVKDQEERVRKGWFPANPKRVEKEQHVAKESGYN